VRFRVPACILLSGLVAPLGCGDDIPTIDPVDRDAGVRCSAGDPPTPPPSGFDGDVADLDAGPPVDSGPPAMSFGCPSGQICQRGFCIPACTNDQQCGAREMCAEGVCVERTTPMEDAGMDAAPDAGPDPCEGTVCVAPTPVCTVVGTTPTCVACTTEDTSICADTMPVCSASNTCVQCTEGDMTQCGGPAPICDIADGSCRAFTETGGGLCAACNTSADCVEGRVCQRLSDRGDERVCLDACVESACANPAFRCDLTLGESGLCVPQLNACSSIRAMIDNRSCLEDSECVPLGAPAPENACQGATPPDTPGVCRVACGGMFACPTGFTCTGMFCTPL